MFRTWGFGILALVGLAGWASAADDHQHEGGHKPPVYEVAGEGADGHFVKKFDFADPAQKKAFQDLVTHGHVHEILNVSPPTISKLASLRYDLGIWTLGIFLAFFFLTQRFLWPTVLGMLKRREENVRNDLEQAEKAKTDAQTLRAALQKEMDSANEKVKGIIDEAKRDAQVTADELIARSRAEMNLERDRMKREIQTETDQALQMLWTRSAELATALSSKALRKQVDLPTHRRLIDEALSELRQAEAQSRAS